jgi:hypothetical protein
MEKKPVISQEEFCQQSNEHKLLYERLAANLQDTLKTSESVAGRREWWL